MSVLFPDFSVEMVRGGTRRTFVLKLNTGYAGNSEFEGSGEGFWRSDSQAEVKVSLGKGSQAVRGQMRTGGPSMALGN